jgi:hypothetical protein
MPDRPDLLEQPGNPAYGLRQHYDMLMQMQDPEELKNAATDIVRQYLGKGITQANWRKFQHVLTKKRDLFSVKKYITDYMMKAANLGVVPPAGGYRESTEVGGDVIMEVAGMLTEDTSIIRGLTPFQRELKEMVENYGFKVVLLG